MSFAGLIKALASDIAMLVFQGVQDFFLQKDQAIDARGIPSAVCPMCGCGWFSVQIAFDDSYEISAYMLDAKCGDCGTLVTAPTPEDVVEGVQMMEANGYFEHKLEQLKAEDSQGKEEQ